MADSGRESVGRKSAYAHATTHPLGSRKPDQLPAGSSVVLNNYLHNALRVVALPDTSRNGPSRFTHAGWALYNGAMRTLLDQVKREHPDWTCLASLDESESYETDITEVWGTWDGYVLVTASGCSCWDGEYGTEDFASLPALLASLYGTQADKRTYTPTYKGIDELIAQIVTPQEA